MTGKVQRIYTRAGDQGRTKLLSGETVSKDELRVETYGALDELQSSLGMARALIRQESLRSIAYAIQKELFIAGTQLASTRSAPSPRQEAITSANVSSLEAKIDVLTESFGLPRFFVVPGTSPGSAALHVARSVCRRVERLAVGLNRHTRSCPEIVIYLNRLSDLLFVMAWAATVSAVVEDVLEELLAMENQPQRVTV